MGVDVIGDARDTDDFCGTLATDWPTGFRPMGLREMDGPFIFPAVDHETAQGRSAGRKAETARLDYSPGRPKQRAPDNQCEIVGVSVVVMLEKPTVDETVRESRRKEDRGLKVLLTTKGLDRSARGDPCAVAARLRCEWLALGPHLFSSLVVANKFLSFAVVI